MGRLLILKKNPNIIADFNNRALFGSFACAALHEDAQHYYVTLIPSADDSAAEELLMQRWQPYIASALTPVHGSARQPTADAAYKYVLAQYPINDVAAVQQFYIKHHSAKLDAFMLNYCRRYIDFDYIDTEQKSLFVFSKNIDSDQPLPPIEQFPGADQYQEFLTDLHELVTTHLQKPSKLSQLACIDNQQLAKQFSPGFFHRNRGTAPATVAATYSSLKP